MSPWRWRYREDWLPYIVLVCLIALGIASTIYLHKQVLERSQRNEMVRAGAVAEIRAELAEIRKDTRAARSYLEQRVKSVEAEVQDVKEAASTPTPTETPEAETRGLWRRFR